jgi:transposase
MVRRLVGPAAMSANALAQEVGVGQPVLSRWLRESRTVGGMASSSNKQWTGAEKLRLLGEARGLGEHALGALLRREGLHEADLAAWQTAAEAALRDVGRRAPRSAEQRRIQELERELRRKDAALAETAALLVLKKKAQAIWGDEDGITDRTPGR